MSTDLSIFVVTAPGLEDVLAAEARALGFAVSEIVPGGITLRGSWRDVWRANMMLRGAGRVLVRIAEFRAMHLAQLDKRARKVDWSSVLKGDIPVRVEATCRKSKIYHAKAAVQRIETAIRETLGAPISQEASIVIKARIEDDLCTISVDSSGEALHKRGHKQFVGKAPMRESMAALFLRQLGFDGSQSVVDPMCGSGTFIIEAAEIAANLVAGRSRHFAFEDFANADPATIEQLRKADAPPATASVRFFGSDRDQGAAQNARKNADRAGVSEWCTFERTAISDLTPPDGVAAGIVVVNPPWGARIGDRKMLFALYGAMGKTLAERFKGWTIGIVSPDAGLIKATGLTLEAAGPSVDMGGTRVTLWKGRIA